MGGNSDGVKAWLRSRHISVLGEWVEACVEWIHEEHRGRVLCGSELCKMVYEQWLDSDLTEIATPCLPPGIKQAKKTQLKGNYALQVNCIQDISSPAYAQLTKLQGRENENALVSAAPATQAKFEPHSSRLLMLSLTDGQETIQAMEYRPVSNLTSTLKPGSKIMLSGDMQCRLGVILLTPTHVKVLGGEVEALKETNSQEKILARAIGVTPPDRPVGSNNQHQGTTPIAGHTNSNTTGTAQSQTITTNHSQEAKQHKTLPRNTSNKASIKQEPHNDTTNQQVWNQGHSRSLQDTKPAGQLIRNQGHSRSLQDAQPSVHQGRRQGPSRSIQDMKPAGPQVWNEGPLTSNLDTKSAGHQGFQDPFLDDEDDGLDELMLEELENLERKEAQKVKTETVPSHEDWDVGDIDEEELLAMEWESSNKQMQYGQGQNHHKEQSHQGHSTAIMSSSGDKANRGPTSVKPFSSVSHSLPGSNVTSIPSSDRTTVPPSKMQLPNAAKTSPTFASNVVPLFKREAKPSASKIAQGHQRTEVPEMQSINSTRRQHIKQGDELGFGKADRSVHQPVSSKMAVATRIIKAEPFSHYGEKKVNQDSVGKTDPGTSSKDSERRDFVSAQSLVKCEEGGNAPKRLRTHSGPRCTRPFVYLIKMADQLREKEACRFDVKGFIMTLVSSLSHNPTWSLAAKINDGTMSLDVDISDNVLSQMIGFTVAEMMEMKASMRKSGKEKAHEIKETIKQGIGRCQQALIDLSCIMTIEVKPEYSRPMMIAVRQPTMDDCNALRQCLEESQ